MNAVTQCQCERFGKTAVPWPTGKCMVCGEQSSHAPTLIEGHVSGVDDEQDGKVTILFESNEGKRYAVVGAYPIADSMTSPLPADNFSAFKLTTVEREAVSTLLRLHAHEQDPNSPPTHDLVRGHLGHKLQAAVKELARVRAELCAKYPLTDRPWCRVCGEPLQLRGDQLTYYYAADFGPLCSYACGGKYKKHQQNGALEINRIEVLTPRKT